MELRLETNVAGFLMEQGIDIFIPSANDCNILKPEKETVIPTSFGVKVVSPYLASTAPIGQEADMVYVVGLYHFSKRMIDIGEK